MNDAVSVIIRGQTFPSMSAAARFHGVSVQCVWSAVERGCTDGVGLGRNWWRRNGAAAPRTAPLEGQVTSPGTPHHKTQQEATH